MGDWETDAARYRKVTIDEIREMRHEIVKLQMALQRLELQVSSGRLDRMSSSFDKLPEMKPMEGWILSVIESYLVLTRLIESPSELLSAIDRLKKFALRYETSTAMKKAGLTSHPSLGLYPNPKP